MSSMMTSIQQGPTNVEQMSTFRTQGSLPEESSASTLMQKNTNESKPGAPEGNLPIFLHREGSVCSSPHGKGVALEENLPEYPSSTIVELSPFACQSKLSTIVIQMKKPVFPHGLEHDET